MTDLGWSDLGGPAVGSAAFKADPYPLYARLRAESPVIRVPIKMPMLTHAHLVTRYVDVAALLRDDRFSKDRANAGGATSRMGTLALRLFAPLMNGMLDKDDPDHARLRRLVQTAFTPRRVDAMAVNIAATADKLLDGLDGRRDIDLIRDFALPLPVNVISDMLGVPDADRARFVRWSNTLIGSAQSPGTMASAVPRVLAFMRYVRALIKKAARSTVRRPDHSTCASAGRWRRLQR